MDLHAPKHRHALTRRHLVGIAGACALATLAPAGPALAVATAPSGASQDMLYELPLMYFFLVPEARGDTIRLILGLTLELDDATAGEAVDEAMPVITDGIWGIFAHTTESQLAGAEGLNQLRADILQVVTDAVGYGRIRDVLFRQILTQRTY
ncbi:MAG: flagellar basal body-associated FliL family protein [Rhodospirillaceae bacterium]|nr:flagellar basal body-associated FliL family protein [Rhodospirillaceae bacterium]